MRRSEAHGPPNVKRPHRLPKSQPPAQPDDASEDWPGSLRGRRHDDQRLRWGLPSTARNPRAAVAQRVRRLEEIVTSIPYLELVKVRDVIRTLERDGWRLDRQVGSHRQFRHPDRPGTVTVAGKPSDEVPKGTLGWIWRQAGRLGRQSGD